MVVVIISLALALACGGNAQVVEDCVRRVEEALFDSCYQAIISTPTLPDATTAEIGTVCCPRYEDLSILVEDTTGQGNPVSLPCLCLDGPAQIFEAVVDDEKAFLGVVRDVCGGLEVTVVRRCVWTVVTHQSQNKRPWGCPQTAINLRRGGGG